MQSVAQRRLRNQRRPLAPKLGRYQEMLKGFTQKSGAIPSEIAQYISTWLEGGLKDGMLSRDGPYFGFKIPGEEDKYFYVWMDAQLDTSSLTERALKESSLEWTDYWSSEDTEIHHFIGKDILFSTHFLASDAASCRVQFANHSQCARYAYG